MSNRTSSPRGAQRQQKKDMIVDIACQLFAESSFDAVSIRHIAAAADCSPALIIKLFGNKDNIYQALLDRLEKVVQEPLVPDIPDAKGVDALEQVYTEALQKLATRLDARTSPLVQAITGHRFKAEDFLAIMSKRQNLYTDVFLPLVIRGQSDGSVRSGDPEAIAYLVTCALHGDEYLNSVVHVDAPNNSFLEVKEYVLSV